MHRHGLPIAPYDADELLLEAVQRTSRVSVNIYQPSDTMVVLGKGSDPLSELHVDHCLADQVPLAGRRGGGCAVVLDPGNVIVSVALPIPGINHTHRYFDFLTERLVRTLNAMGYGPIYRDGKSDLVLQNRKIGGSCVYRTKGLLYYSSTILVAPDIHKIERYLQYPPREPAYRGGRSHAEFIGSLVSKGTTAHAARLVRELTEYVQHDDLSLQEIVTENSAALPVMSCT